MATSPTSGPGGGGGGDLAATLALGSDAAGIAITSLNEIDSDAQPSTSDYSRLTLDAFGSGGNAALTAASADPAGAGGNANLAGGAGDAGNTEGASVRASGGSATADGKLLVRTDGSFGTAGYALVADGTSVVYDDLGGLKLDTHAAPADASLAAGELRLWFDQTNGVGNTKLMVKAKSADGTVKTATIVLA